MSTTCHSGLVRGLAEAHPGETISRRTRTRGRTQGRTRTGRRGGRRGRRGHR